MSKPITLTDEIIERTVEEFRKTLVGGKGKLIDGTVKFEKKFSYKKAENDNDKVHLDITSKAYTKMLLLLKSFNTEVAWHGVSERTDTGFVIKDVLVYPQTVTGANVTTDQEAYQKWMMELDDDIYNNLRCQMHSHVNFACSPSGVDSNHREQIIAQLRKDEYYIFMIWNKDLKHELKIYDFRDNVCYDDDDVVLDIVDEGHSMMAFAQEAVGLVKNSTLYSATTTAATKGKDDKKSETKKSSISSSSATTKPYPTYAGEYGYGGYGYCGAYGGYYGDGEDYGRQVDWDKEIFGNKKS